MRDPARLSNREQDRTAKPAVDRGVWCRQQVLLPAPV